MTYLAITGALWCTVLLHLPLWGPVSPCGPELQQHLYRMHVTHTCGQRAASTFHQAEAEPQQLNFGNARLQGGRGDRPWSGHMGNTPWKNMDFTYCLLLGIQKKKRKKKGRSPCLSGCWLRTEPCCCSSSSATDCSMMCCQDMQALQPALNSSRLLCTCTFLKGNKLCWAYPQGASGWHTVCSALPPLWGCQHG